MVDWEVFDTGYAERRKLDLLADHIERTSQLGSKARGPAPTIALDAPLEEILAQREALFKKKYDVVKKGLPKLALDALRSWTSHGGLRVGTTQNSGACVR